MSKLDNNNFKGISTLFDASELKKFIKYYISLIFLL